MRRPNLAGSVTVAWLLLAGTAASAETSATANAKLDGGYASNPYGTSAGGTGSATIAGTISPTVTIDSPTGMTQIGGDVTHTEYAQRYSGTTDYNLGASTNRKISPLTSFNASAGFSSRVRNTLNPISSPDVIIDPNNPDAPIIVDPSAADTFTRRTVTYNGSVGISSTLSPRDTISVSAYGSKVRFPQGSLLSRGYGRYGASLSYMRAVGASSSIGLSFGSSHSDFDGGSLGDSTQYSPSALFNTNLAPRLALKLSAGITFSNTTLLGGSLNSSSFSGSANLCNQGDRSNLCITVARSVAPSTASGTSTVTSFGSNYRYEIDSRSQFTVGVSYSRASSLAGLGGIRADYGNARAGYSRKLTERLSATASATYSDSFRSSSARRANIFGSVGIRYRLGTI